MHENSLEAFEEEKPHFSKREALIVEFMGKREMSDKAVAHGLGFSAKAAVQPRISELLDRGILEECGSEIDADTGKRCRLTRRRVKPEPAPKRAPQIEQGSLF